MRPLPRIGPRPVDDPPDLVGTRWHAADRGRRVSLRDRRKEDRHRWPVDRGLRDDCHARSSEENLCRCLRGFVARGVRPRYGSWLRLAPLRSGRYNRFRNFSRTGHAPKPYEGVTGYPAGTFFTGSSNAVLAMGARQTCLRDRSSADAKLAGQLCKPCDRRSGGACRSYATVLPPRKSPVLPRFVLREVAPRERRTL